MNFDMKNSFYFAVFSMVLFVGGVCHACYADVLLGCSSPDECGVYVCVDTNCLPGCGEFNVRVK